MIKSLDPNVIKQLRSDIAFSSVAQCVEELVWNSIDSGANCIAVRLNLPFFRIQVIDNGCGIPADQMVLVGKRYATSKCHTLEDLQNLQYGGFRGEALASLKDVASNLMIESRAHNCPETYCKIFTHGNASAPTLSINSRPSKGTTVTVFGFMYNRPVRKQTISEAIDLEETRRLLQSIALVHPQISFSLQSEATGEMYLQFKKCSSIFYSFMELFGKDKARNLKQVEHELEGYHINGYISIDAFSSKDYRFLYVNKRLLRKTRLHALINSLLNKAFSRKQVDTRVQAFSPSKNQCQYGAFVLDIVCDRNKYDTVFDRKRTMVEFLEWDSVSKLVEVAIMKFLKSEKLISSPVTEDELQPTNPKISENGNSRFLNLGVDNFKNGLFSHAVKRLESYKSVHDLGLAHEKNADINIVSNEPIVKENNKAETIPVCTESIQKNSPILDNSKSDASNIISKDKNYICLGNALNPSILDTLKETTSKDITGTNKMISLASTITPIPSAVEEQTDIPCRSVFPINSPVMLRVTAKSTLSQLQGKAGPSRMLLNLKEKYLFSRQRNRKLPEIPGKNAKNVVEASHHESLLALINQRDDVSKSKKNKEISYGIQNNCEPQPSGVVDKSDSRITSKYKFQDINSSSLKRLRQSSKTKTKLPTLLEVGNDLETFCLDIENDKTKDNSTSSTNHIPERKNFKRTHDTFKSLEEKGIFDGSETLLPDKANKVCENDSSSCKDSRILIKDRRKMLKNGKCSRNNTSSTSNFSETNVSSFFLKTFSPNKRKINENVVAQENDKTETKVLPLRNFNQFDSRDIDENIKSNSENTNSDISLVYRFKTSSDLVSPHNFFPIKKLKSHSTISDSPGSDESISNSCVKTPVKLNKSAVVDTNIPVAKMEGNRTFASRLFQDLNSDVCLSELIENDHFPKLYLPEKSNAFSFSENNTNDQVIQNDFTIQVQSDITQSSYESYPMIISQNKSFSSIYKKNMKQSKQNIGNVDDDTERFSSIIDSSPELNFHSKSKNIFAKNKVSTQEIQKVILTEDRNIPSSTKESSPSGNEIDFVIDSKSKIVSGVKSIEPYDTSLEFLTVFKNSSLSSTTSNSDVTDFHDGIKSPINISALEKYTLHPHIIPEALSSGKLDSSSVNKSSFPCNAINDTTLAEIPECKSNFVTENSFNSTSLPLSEIKIQDQTTYTDNCYDELPNIIEDNNLHNHINSISSEPVINEVSGMTYTKLLQDNESRVETGNIKVDRLDSKMNPTTVKQAEDAANKSRWIQVNEEAKRVAYIDSITGNSTYDEPIMLQDKDALSTKDLSANQKKKPHFFLTHDFSPFVRNVHSPKEPEGIDMEISDLQINLNSYIDHNENTDWQRKWRYPIETESSCDNSIQDMFHKWENPMFDIASEMNGIEDSKVPVCLPHMYFINSYRFNSNSLDSLKVIGQVDCKFIACIIQDFSDNYKNRKLLTLFDQHAVHERIRLEELTDDLYITKKDGRRIVNSQAINPPLNLSLEQSEIQLLHSYHKSLQDLGIFINFKDDINIVEAYSLPVCLVHMDSNQLRRRPSEMSVLVEKIIKEWLSSIMQNRGVSSLLPQTLSAVLNSQACRGAVKFGDPLNYAQCENLLTSLANCKLPFQCAHGRPSIAPILDLNKIEAICKKRHPPKLWKLREDTNDRMM